MMNAMEKMTKMSTEGQKQIAEHKAKMEKAMGEMMKGKFPVGVGPLNRLTGDRREALPPSFPDESSPPPQT